MSQFTGLEIGKRAILAQRLGLDATSNNIANVNTPGYARQQVVFTETDPRSLIGKGFIGTGVAVSQIRSFREEYFDREIRGNISRNAGFALDDRTLQRIETLLREPGDGGLDSSMKKFFNAFNDLSLKPEDLGRRNLALEAGRTLAEDFRTTAAAVQDLRKQTSERLATGVGEANRILSDIAELNKQITATKSQSLDTWTTLVNQRSLKLEELAKFGGPLHVSIDNNGHANVSMAGSSVVTGTAANRLKLNETIDISGERTTTLDIVNQQGTTLVTIRPESGEFASSLKHLNITLDDKDTSGGFSVAKELNIMATALISKVNAITSTGYGLDDVSLPTRNFFVGTSAASIDIDSSVKDKPRDIPVSSGAGLAGDNTIARQIVELADNSTFLSNQTPLEYYANFLNKIAATGADASTGVKVTETVGDQLNAQRESVIGVNLDEEAVNLIKYQRAFEAAARVVNSTNEVLQTVINLGQ